MLQGVLVAQLGARLHYAVPELLVRDGALTHFHTDIVSGSGPLGAVGRLGVLGKAGRRYAGRTISGALRSRTVEHRLLGVRMLAGLRLARTAVDRRLVFEQTAFRFGRAVLKHGIGGAKVIYGCTAASGIVFRAGRDEGSQRVLDQFIAAQRWRDKFLADEQHDYTDWEDAADHTADDTSLYDRVEEEWELATTILCPSSFVRDSLIEAGVEAGKLRVVPYGVPLKVWSDAAKSSALGRAGEQRPLNVLFVGTVELRKGIHYLYDALQRLGSSVTARIIGPVRLTDEGAQRLSSVAEVLGQIPRSEVKTHFEWADVFVLPSLVEGSATVTYEALTNGTPVVCTPNAGSVVEAGRTGLIVPVRSGAALADAMAQLAQDRPLLQQMTSNVFALEDRASVETYRRNLLSAMGSS